MELRVFLKSGGHEKKNHVCFRPKIVEGFVRKPAKNKSVYLSALSLRVFLVCSADSECRPIPSPIIYVCFPFSTLLDIFIFDPHLQNEWRTVEHLHKHTSVQFDV